MGKTAKCLSMQDFVSISLIFGAIEVRLARTRPSFRFIGKRGIRREAHVLLVSLFFSGYQLHGYSPSTIRRRRHIGHVAKGAWERILLMRLESNVLRHALQAPSCTSDNATPPHALRVFSYTFSNSPSTCSARETRAFSPSSIAARRDPPTFWNEAIRSRSLASRSASARPSR